MTVEKLACKDELVCRLTSRFCRRMTEFYSYPKDIRRAVYTTNAIESLNSSYRKLNRQRSVFPSDQSLLKALYLATFEAAKKWTQPIHGWGQAYGEMCIMYEDRLPD